MRASNAAPIAAHHRAAEQIGLVLHQPVIVGRPAVHHQRRQGELLMLTHRHHHVGYLIGDGLQRRTDQMRAFHPATQAANQAAGAVVPPGRAKTGQRRHEVDPEG